MSITIDNLTYLPVTDFNNVVVGTIEPTTGKKAILDSLMEVVNVHLKPQFELGRLTGTD